jgi:two-component system, OmpR family, response regulator
MKKSGRNFVAKKAEFQFFLMYTLNDTMTTVLKILIVDDEPDICYFLSGNFSRRGFSTSFSHSLAEAQKQLEFNTPAVLLLDNHLPDGRGIDSVNKIKSKYPELKIIMITAHDTPQDRLKAYSNGVDYFLSKPFTITGVNNVVDLVLGNP